MRHETALALAEAVEFGMPTVSKSGNRVMRRPASVSLDPLATGFPSEPVGFLYPLTSRTWTSTGCA